MLLAVVIGIGLISVAAVFVLLGMIVLDVA